MNQDNTKDALFTGLRIKSGHIPEMVTVKKNIDALLNKRAKRIFMYKMTAVAASLLLIGVFIAFMRNPTMGESTAYAVTKEVVLPDGSKVLLNAHSTLHYKKRWNSWKEREVWIEGEAFFTVTKKPSGYHPKFVVHANGLDVAVIGTEFNVYCRRNRVVVVLEKGKVTATGTGDIKGTCSMHPGQMIELNSTGIHLSDVNPVAYTSWKQHRLYFTNAPLSRVAQVLEDNYGYHITWKDKKRMQDTFTGSCPADDTQMLLKAIGLVYNMSVTVKGNTIIFQ